jgi:hypothetical protein
MKIPSPFLPLFLYPLLLVLDFVYVLKPEYLIKLMSKLLQATPSSPGVIAPTALDTVFFPPLPFFL